MAALALGLFNPLVSGVILRITPDGFYTIVALFMLGFSGWWLTLNRPIWRIMTAATLGALGIQIILTSFFFSMLGLRYRPQRVG